MTTAVQTDKGLLEKVSEIVLEIDSKVSRVRWTNEQIGQKFGKRGALKIVEEGDTCFMGPCLDLSLVAYEMLQSRGINPVFVVQELAQDIYPFPKMHFALEFQHASRLYFLDFKSMNKVVLRPGKFVNLREGIRSLSLARIRSRLSPAKSLFENILTGEVKEPEARELLTRYLNCHLNVQVSRLKRDNIPKTYAEYLARLGEKRELYLDSTVE
jgi:hypothetical protein